MPLALHLAGLGQYFGEMPLPPRRIGDMIRAQAFDAGAFKDGFDPLPDAGSGFRYPIPDRAEHAKNIIGSDMRDGPRADHREGMGF
jgi:hypothetical protein